eukprot:4206163-Amphidinium_carterae.1
MKCIGAFHIVMRRSETLRAFSRRGSSTWEGTLGLPSIDPLRVAVALLRLSLVLELLLLRAIAPFPVDDHINALTFYSPTLASARSCDKFLIDVGAFSHKLAAERCTCKVASLSESTSSHGT